MIVRSEREFARPSVVGVGLGGGTIDRPADHRARTASPPARAERHRRIVLPEREGVGER
jgi:hypothetical protein